MPPPDDSSPFEPRRLSFEELVVACYPVAAQGHTVAGKSGAIRERAIADAINEAVLTAKKIRETCDAFEATSRAMVPAYPANGGPQPQRPIFDRG